MSNNKILFLFYRSPLENSSSTNRRQYLIYSTLKEFSNETKILTLGDADRLGEEQIVVANKKSNLKKIFNFLLLLRSPRLTHYYSNKFKKSFEETIIKFKPDYIYVEHLLMMQYVINLKTSAKIIFFNDESNLFVKVKNLRGNFYQKLRNLRLAELEKTACSKADVVLTITENEEKFLEQKGFKNVFTIPFGIDTGYFSFSWEMPNENSILFVGDFSHYPNRQAIKILAGKIIPALPEFKVKLKIVGRNTNRIEKYTKGQVEIYDNIEDVRPYYYNTAVFAAPIITGAGLRVKILEAALCGIPLVISPIANLGINLANKEEAFICKSVVEFKEALRNFFSSKFDDKINRIRINSRNKIASEFGEIIVKDKIISVIDRIIT